MKLTKEQEKVIRDFLEETGFEIWNSSCTYRIGIDNSLSERDVTVCTYHDPLHPVKEFKTIQGAVNFLQKEDEK